MVSFFKLPVLILLNLGITTGHQLPRFTNKIVIPPLDQTEFHYNFEIKKSTTTIANVGDGYERYVVVVNGGIPGPSIVVWNDATVTVSVKNFLDEPTILHWHGLDMKDQFWYDGVPNINQCPIQPGDTFQYKIKITNDPGTYWYHSHAGGQRGDGCYGAFIVLDRHKYKHGGIRPQEFVVLITDWWPEPIKTFDGPQNAKTLRDAVKQMASDIKFHSALINGKGTRPDPTSETEGQTEILQCRCGENESPVVLRVIHVGITWTLKIQVAGHQLKFLATDGYDVIGNNQVDAVFLNSGERYDLQLVKTTHRNVDGFRIRIDTSAKYDDEGNEAAVQYYYGEAILNCGHEGHSTLHPSPILEVDTTHCTGAKKCKVLNCPFRQFPPSDVFHCVNIRDYKSARRLENRLSNKHPDDEIFLNIGGIESESFFKINNIKMTQATFPPYEAIRQGGKLGDVAELCDTDCGQQKRCECFEPVTLEKDRLVQFVIYNKINKTDAKVSMGHPFHFHGYHFYVVKVGYPSYDSSGFVHEAETDITCTTTNCTLEKWAEKPNFRETDFNYIDPPYKDTIFVPYGGYVVIRFISHNIGWFVIHCHMVIHEGNGLMRPLKVGTDEEIENLVQHKRPHEYQSCPTYFQPHNTPAMDEVIEDTSDRNDCVWSHWSDFSPCSATCGEGTKTRLRYREVQTRNSQCCVGSEIDVTSCSSGKLCFDGVVARFCASADSSGFYPVGNCTSLYIVCMGTQSRYLFCPSGMRFDNRTNECRPKKLVHQCRNHAD